MNSMGFDKPLKLFLSYSHRDDLDRSLFQEFRNHLMGLEDDGLIEVWWDREITAGTRWDDEIKSHLNESRVFLALTSASFNASRYVRDHELPLAWERYDAEQCLIMPVMWRKWDPPETSRWRDFQFLNAPDKAVHSAPENERDDILCAIVERLRHAIKKGQMPGPKPGSAARTPLPVELPYLCDWVEPISKLAALKGGAQRRPAVLVLIGTLEDCAEEFLRRAHPQEFRQKLGLTDGAPAPDIEILDWPSSAEPLFDHLRPSVQAARNGLLVWKLTTSGWNSEKEAMLRSVLEGLRAPEWDLPPDQALVTVVSVITRDRDPGLPDAIQRVLDSTPDVPAVAIQMPEVKLDDALNWASHAEVRRRCRAGSHLGLTQNITALYEKQGVTEMQIGRLAPQLIDILEQYRERGAA